MLNQLFISLTAVPYLFPWFSVFRCVLLVGKLAYWWWYESKWCAKSIHPYRRNGSAFMFILCMNSSLTREPSSFLLSLQLCWNLRFPFTLEFRIPSGKCKVKGHEAFLSLFSSSGESLSSIPDFFSQKMNGVILSFLWCLDACLKSEGKWVLISAFQG